MIYTFIARARTDLPVSACCRVMRVSTSGFYAWRANPVRSEGPRRRLSEQHHRRHLDHEPPFLWLARVHAELKLGLKTCAARANGSSA